MSARRVAGRGGIGAGRLQDLVRLPAPPSFTHTTEPHTMSGPRLLGPDGAAIEREPPDTPDASPDDSPDPEPRYTCTVAHEQVNQAQTFDTREEAEAWGEKIGALLRESWPDDPEPTITTAQQAEEKPCDYVCTIERDGEQIQSAAFDDLETAQQWGTAGAEAIEGNATWSVEPRPRATKQREVTCRLTFYVDGLPYGHNVQELQDVQKAPFTAAAMNATIAQLRLRPDRLALVAAQLVGMWANHMERAFAKLSNTVAALEGAPMGEIAANMDPDELAAQIAKLKGEQPRPSRRGKGKR